MSEDRKYLHQTKDAALAYIGIRVVDNVCEKLSLLHKGVNKLTRVLSEVLGFKLRDGFGSYCDGFKDGLESWGLLHSKQGDNTLREEADLIFKHKRFKHVINMLVDIALGGGRVLA